MRERVHKMLKADFTIREIFCKYRNKMIPYYRRSPSTSFSQMTKIVNVCDHQCACVKGRHTV